MGEFIECEDTQLVIKTSCASNQGHHAAAGVGSRRVRETRKAALYQQSPPYTGLASDYTRLYVLTNVTNNHFQAAC